MIAATTLCSFGNNKKHTMQRRQGVLLETKKGIEFVPLEDWKDYTPRVNGDTVYQYRTS